LPPAGEGPYLICPGAFAGGGFNSRLGLYTDDPAPGRVGVIGASEATSDLKPTGLGSATVNIGDLAELGATPVLLEHGGGLAAATFSGTSEAASISGCRRGESGPMAVLGIATLGEDSAELQLVNPFAQDASLRLEVVSELGPDTPRDLETIRVPAASHVEVPLTRVLTGREAVSIGVEATSGLVAAAAVRHGPTDLAVTEGVGGRLEWYFPLPGAVLTGSLHLRSVADLVGDFRIDRIDTTGTVEAVAEGTINPGQQVVMPVTDLAPAPGGLLVAATEPLVAGLVLEADQVRAVTVGGGQGSRWVVPVTAAPGEGQNLIWVFNPGAVVATVNLARLQSAELVSPVEVGAGEVVELSIPRLTGSGLLVESDQPVVVAYGVFQGTGVGLAIAELLE
jgi:hypothetical protein